MQLVKDADDDLRMRIFTEQFDKAVREEIPLAAQIVKRAQFFLLVLDEDVPEAAWMTSMAARITEEALQLVAHPARVHLFELPSGKEVLRVRRSGDARFIPAGERAVTDPETRDAMQRQVNNCALARTRRRGADPRQPRGAISRRERRRRHRSGAALGAQRGASSPKSTKCVATTWCHASVIATKADRSSAVSTTPAPSA